MSVFERLSSRTSASGNAGVFSRIQQERDQQRKESLRQFNQAVPTDYRQTPLFKNVRQLSQQQQQQAQDQTRQALSQLPMRSGQLTQRLQNQLPEPKPSPTLGQVASDTLRDVGQRVSAPFRFINRASQSFAESLIPDAPMIGRREDGSYGNLDGPTARERYLEQNPRTDAGRGNQAADVIGQVGSYFLNPANPAQGPMALYNLPAVQNIANRVGLGAGQRTGSNVAARVGEEATREGLAAAAYAVPRSLITGETSAREIGENVAVEGALGAAGGGVLAAASPLVRKGIEAVLDRFPKQRQQEILSLPDPEARISREPQEVLALPEPSPRRLREGPQQGEGIIQARPNRVSEQIRNRPLGLPEPSFQGTAARQAPNPYRVKFENLIRRANELEQRGQFTPGREFEELQDLWSRMAERTDPGLDQLIDWAYPSQRQITPNALRRGRTAQAAGVGPSVSRYSQEIGEAAAPRQRLGVFKRLQDQSTPVQSIDNARPPQPIETQAKQETNVQGSTELPTELPTKSEQPMGEIPRQEQPMVQQTSQQTESITPEPPQPRVRDRLVQQMDEMEQAARQRIAAQRNRVSSNPLDIYRDYAIIGASKMVKGTVKFADWSEAMVREFGEEIRPRLRQVYEQSREMYQRTTKQAQEAIEFAESGKGDAGSFREKIARGKETKTRSSFMEKVDTLRTQLVDSAAPLERLEKNIRGKISPAEESLYKTARLFKGVPARANEIVRTRLGPIMDQVESAGFKPDDLGDYALAMHSRDVNNKGIMSGFTNKEIDEVVQRFDRPEMEQARQSLVQLGNEMLEDLMDAQVISRELFETLRARYPNYIPLFRHFDDSKVEFGQGLSDSMANVGSPIQRLQGSQRRVIDPLENMVSNIFHSVNNAERNRVALQLAKLADEDVSNQFIRRLEPNEKVGRKNVVSVRMEGEQVQFEVQPEVYKAILGLDEESAGVITNLLQKPASLLRAGATLTPEFSLRNPVRDLVQAYITSNSGYNPITDFPVALIETITRGRGIRIGNRTIGGNDLYTQFLQDNAGYGNIISMDRKVHRESLERVLKQSPGRKFVNIVNGRSLLNVLRTVADTTETAVKLGEYRAALRSGASRPEAAYRSRDVMDFARAGTKVRNLNKAIAFLNANIQGKSKIVRSIKENPTGVTARGLKMVTMPTIGVFLAQKYLGNDTQQTVIRDAPNWMRNSFWLVPIPGTDQVARIPKPFDIAPIFANGPERLMEYIFENDQEAFDNFVQDSVGSMSLPVMLTGLVPFIEGMANYSFFRQGPIIPQREQGIEYRDQYDLDTPATARGLARVAETVTGGEGALANFSSPRITENLIRGLTAGLGDYANSAIDFFVKDLSGGEIERPKKDISQKPLARSFLVNQGSTGRSMDDLYTAREQLTRQRGSARLRNEEFENEAQYQFVNKLTSEVGKITKLIRDIESNEQLTSEQKGQAITKLNQRRNDLARRGMERYREVFGGR